MKDFIPKLMLLFAIAGISFSYGFLSNRFELFPYETIRDGYLAYQALVELASEQPDLKNIDFWDESGLTEPAYRELDPKAGKERIFILGNERTYPAADGVHSYLAWIADREGNVLHGWRDPGEIWVPLRDREAVGGKWRSYPVGAQLFPNGDILVSYQGVGAYPSAMGLARFDKESRLLWKNDDFYHHWFSTGPDGEIYIPDLEFATSPIQVPDRDKRIACRKVRFPYDSIAVLDADGNEFREIDMLNAIVNSDLAGLFNSNKEKPHVVETCDPTHLNDAQILSAEMAAQYPSFEAGDLLVSFRTLNMIGVIDPDTERFKWHFVGPSHHQHSPRYVGNNRILFFDNYGGSTSRGTSRIIAVDVETQAFETVFPKDGRELPETEFFSDTAGHLDISDSRDRVLVSWTHQGLVWEIDIESGDVLWELVNTHLVEEQAARVSVYTAKYVQSADFPMNGGILPAPGQD